MKSLIICLLSVIIGSAWSVELRRDAEVHKCKEIHNIKFSISMWHNCDLKRNQHFVAIISSNLNNNMKPICVEGGHQKDFNQKQVYPKSRLLAKIFS